MRSRVVAVFSVFVFVLLASGFAGTPSYKVVNHFKPGGDGGWDYLAVDGPGRHIYVSRGTRVQVVNADTGQLEKEIPDTQGVHGIALAPELHRGFISAGRANKIVVFDDKTFATTGTVDAGENPDAILYDPTTKRVFAFNGRSKSATIVDAQTLKVLSTLPLSGKPEYSQHDDHGNVYVNIEDLHKIAHIDAKNMKVVEEWDLGKCEEPSGLAIDRKKSRLFAGCGNQEMAIVDYKAGKLLAEVPIGKGVDGAEFDPSTGYAFSANGRDGTISVVGETSPGKFEAVQTPETMRSARTIVLDPKTHHLILPAAKFGEAQQGQRPPMVPDSFELVVVGQ